MKKQTNILVVSDKYANFAHHAIMETAKRMFPHNARILNSLKACFLGDDVLVFHWANHKSLSAICHARYLDFEEIHMSGYIDEDMVEYFEILRDAKKRAGKQVKVIINESGS